MPFLHEIKDRLVAQGVGVYGTNIFIGSGTVIPTGQGPYLSLIETGGSASNKTQNDTATETPTAQVLVRATSQPNARTMAKAAYNALGGPNGLYNLVLTGIAYISLKARQNITDIGVDADKRAMLSFNIEAEKYPS